MVSLFTLAEGRHCLGHQFISSRFDTLDTKAKSFFLTVWPKFQAIDKPAPASQNENEEPHAEEPGPEKANDEKPGDGTLDVQEPDSQSCFKVSMKHLALASPRAKKMFDGNYTEAQPDADGLRRWKFEPIFDPDAFEIVLNAIHGHTHKLPEEVSLEALADIAAIVDDLDCSQALWFPAKIWIKRFDSTQHTIKLPYWILVSFVFNEPTLFTRVTKYAIQNGTGPFHNAGLPIRPEIIGATATQTSS